MKRDAQKALLAAAGRYIRRQFGELEPRLKALESRPAPLKGDPGDPGASGKDGRDGLDGRSVTLEEVRTYLDAELATWALGFERRAQDVLHRAIERMEKPKDGRDGADGFSLDDLQIEQRDERTVVIRFVRGDLKREHTLRLGCPLDQGVFRDGETYQHGDGVTFGGSWWIAQKDSPQGKPGMSADWRLAVKKGRDGKDWSPRT
jgi:hypothetical protein